MRDGLPEPAGLRECVAAQRETGLLRGASPERSGGGEEARSLLLVYCLLPLRRFKADGGHPVLGDSGDRVKSVDREQVGRNLVDLEAIHALGDEGPVVQPPGEPGALAPGCVCQRLGSRLESPA
jgi:hypothetical protein